MSADALTASIYSSLAAMIYNDSIHVFLTLTNHSSILVVATVIVPPCIMPAVSDSGFISIAFYIVQQNGSSSFAEMSHSHGLTTTKTQLSACYSSISIFPPEICSITQKGVQTSLYNLHLIHYSRADYTGSGTLLTHENEFSFHWISAAWWIYATVKMASIGSGEKPLPQPMLIVYCSGTNWSEISSTYNYYSGKWISICYLRVW